MRTRQLPLRWGGKLALALMLISVLSLLSLFVHWMVTDEGVLRQEPTTKQSEYQQFHYNISLILVRSAGISFLATYVVGAILLFHWYIKKLWSKR
jgi:hypothetical protein